MDNNNDILNHNEENEEEIDEGNIFALQYIFPIRMLNGSVRQVLEWSDFDLGPGVVLYEVTAQLVCINTKYPTNFPVPGNEISLLIKDRYQVGPALEVIHPYFLFPEFPRNLIPGLLVKCVGNLNGAKQMIASKIRSVSQFEEACYNRLAHISNYSV